MTQSELFLLAHKVVKAYGQETLTRHLDTYSYALAFRYALKTVWKIHRKAILAEYHRAKHEDAVLTLIAKFGGLNRTEASRQGIDSADFQMKVGIRYVFVKNGLSFDAMAEQLDQFGVFFNESYCPNKLLDLIDNEIRA